MLVAQGSTGDSASTSITVTMLLVVSPNSGTPGQSIPAMVVPNETVEIYVNGADDHASCSTGTSGTCSTIFFLPVNLPPGSYPLTAKGSNGDSATVTVMITQACTVTDNSDSPNDSGSLRYCVNTATSGDTIGFASSLNRQTIALSPANGPLIIGKNLTIQGPGANLLTITGGNAVGVFSINSSLTVSISGLTIANGNAGTGGSGGGIDIGTGTNVKVANSTFSGNSAGNGGGIYNSGTLAITNRTFSSNRATSQGGGIFNSTTATLTLSSSTLANNSSAGEGGGILNSGTLVVTSSTVSGNSATGGTGGGISNFASLTFIHSTRPSTYRRVRSPTNCSGVWSRRRCRTPFTNRSRPSPTSPAFLSPSAAWKKFCEMRLWTLTPFISNAPPHRRKPPSSWRRSMARAFLWSARRRTTHRATHQGT